MMGDETDRDDIIGIDIIYDSFRRRSRNINGLIDVENRNVT